MIKRTYARADFGPMRRENGSYVDRKSTTSQLHALQTPTNPIFELSKYQRKQLICDME
jgi:hypothetical protein